MRQRQSPPERSKRVEIATLGGGCFWCTEAVFSESRGVENVESGYCGGDVADPTYNQVATGTTGHAEVVQITFDHEVTSFEELLEVFFAVHNPTTWNRQGSDVGSQYRSVIFYHDDQQKAIAEKVIEELNTAKVWDAPIVTQIEPFGVFYKAEKHHRDYYQHHPAQPYCRFVIAPKIVKLRKQFKEQFKT